MKLAAMGLINWSLASINKAPAVAEWGTFRLSVWALPDYARAVEVVVVVGI